MVERLLFDWVYAKTGALAVSREHHLVVNILTNETKAPITFVQLALTRAEITDNQITLPMPPLARMLEIAPAQNIKIL